MATVLPGATLENGRHWVQWQIRSRNRVICLRWWPGDFDVLRITFTTRSGGREVALELLYVDRGNLDRAPWAMTSCERMG